MAFSHVRCTMTFTRANGDQFTESYYRASNILGSWLPAASGPAVPFISLVEKRLKPLAKAWSIKTLTITAAPIPPLETSPRLAMKWEPTVYRGNYDVLSDTGNTVIKVPIFAGSEYSRVLPIHGIADSSVTFDANGMDTTGIGNQTQIFLDHLCSAANGWQLKVRLIRAGDLVNTKSVDNIAVANGIVSYTVPGLAQQVNGRKFLVSGAQGFKVGQFNGEFKIRSHDIGTGVITAEPGRYIDARFFYVGGSARLRTVDASLVSFADLTGYAAGNAKSGTHKVGNPSEKRAGRRSKKR